MSIEVLLSRLHKVRKNGPNKWMACCPAHEDRSPSLSLAEPEPGKILIHCFAGCETSDVLASVGLRMEDLFPDNARDSHFKPLYWATREKQQQDKKAADLRHKEVTLIFYENAIKEGRKFSPEENEKYLKLFMEVNRAKKVQAA